MTNNWLSEGSLTRDANGSSRWANSLAAVITVGAREL